MTTADYCDECKGRAHAPWCSVYVSADRCPQCGGLNTSRGKTRLWCNDCQRHTWTYGTYKPAEEVSSEHQPAARGEGDAAGLVPATVLALAKKNQQIYDTELSNALVKAVEVAHAEHQSLVAERERLTRALETVRDSYWSENEPYSERVEYLQRFAKNALTANQNRRSE